MAPPSKVVVACNEIVKKRKNREHMSSEILLETIENELESQKVEMNELVVQLLTDIQKNETDYLTTQKKINDDVQILGVSGANKFISNIIPLLPDEDIDDHLRKSFKKIVKSTPDELRVEQMHISVMIEYLQSRQKKVNSVLEFKANKYMSIKKEMLSI